jgi:hypothetical protein
MKKQKKLMPIHVNEMKKIILNNFTGGGGDVTGGGYVAPSAPVEGYWYSLDDSSGNRYDCHYDTDASVTTDANCQGYCFKKVRGG